jgi:hypothetical protein
MIFLNRGINDKTANTMTVITKAVTAVIICERAIPRNAIVKRKVFLPHFSLSFTKSQTAYARTGINDEAMYELIPALYTISHMK